MASDVHQKALAVNLDPTRYGSFAEIGAGQEVVRWFFRVGGAAGTIAKSISAYDMEVSDVIYGRAQRYVSRSRLEAMLAHEHALNVERLSELRGADTAFFAFADTVAARSYLGTSECHAWMGTRFQASPGAGDALEDILAQDSIVRRRTTGKREVTVDLRPLIETARLGSAGELEDMSGSGLPAHASVVLVDARAVDGRWIRPSELVALLAERGLEAAWVARRIFADEGAP